jgi:hypothetical protein
MPSAGQISFVYDQTRMRWMTSLTSGRFQLPLNLTEGNTIDFVFRLSNNGTLFTPALTPVWIFGIKDADTPNGSFLIQVNSATAASGVFTFVVELASAELQTWLATATSQSYAAIQITDSANDIATGPLLCQIEPNQNDTGTTPTSANGTLVVAATKTVTFPQSLTFPSDTGTDNYQLTTNGAGVLTWEAGGALTDGDKGEITVSASGATWTIDNDVVGLAKLAHMATARVVGRTTAGTGTPELLTISGTGSVAMTNTPTLVTPVLGAATAISINGITITAGGSGTLTMAGSINTNGPSGGPIDTSNNGGSITTAGGATSTGGSINTSGSGAYSGGYINTGAGGTGGGGSINLSNGGGGIYTDGGGGSITTYGSGTIELGTAGVSTMTTFTGAASGSNKSIALPNLSGTVVVTASVGTTATHALFANTTGFPAYRAIATADIATALTTPGAIGGTTAATSVKIANGSAASTALQIGAVSNGVYSPNGAGTDVGISANGALVAFWNSSWGLVALQPIIPNSNGLTSVGTSGMRWSNVFSVLGNFSGAVTCSTTLAVTSTTTMTGRLTANGGITVVGGSYLLTTNSSLTNGSGSSVGTLTNAPDTGNPTKWIAINDNGTERYIPTWTAPPPPP